jgi:maleylpyruvate isomerase
MRSADLQRDMDGCIKSQQLLVEALAKLTDQQARADSVLPGWTVGHVLTHLARNADSLVHLFECAERGEVGSQYPSLESRNAGIEAGAGRPAAELVDDVRAANVRLESTWSMASDAAWSGEGVAVSGRVALTEVPSRRWREVVVHHGDLGAAIDGAAYGPDQWPADYVRLELRRMEMLWASRQPMGMTTLPPPALATPDRQRLAWLLGRGQIEGLAPAGIF